MDDDLLTRLVAGTRVFDLGQTLSSDAPHHPNYPPFSMVLQYHHGDVVAPSGMTFTSALIYASDHYGTHVDGLGHCSDNGRLMDGIDAYDVQRGGRGLTALGIETMAPLVCRGVLVDMASDREVECLPPDTVITASDLEVVSAREGVDVRPGDAVLIRTGHGRYWHEPARYFDPAHGDPGLGPAASEWLATRKIALAGADNAAFEAVTSDSPDFGKGHIALLGSGIPIVENLNLESLSEAGVHEFLFVMSPLKIVGGTGSPVRPIAIA